MFESSSTFKVVENPVHQEKKDEEIVINEFFFINFLNILEGYKTKNKNLHWAAPKNNIHERLDEFFEILGDYQDSLAEQYMGILGKMLPNVIEGVIPQALNANEFISELLNDTMNFYKVLNNADIMYAGIKSECETFIAKINQYKYLFSLCDVQLPNNY
ncbi:MAG: hypothetical protein LBM05_00585 [Endomicrobium sp.]|jgi:hypothetical protein|nr:hypothetical protein [Endomicrobium sp.]